MEELDLEKLVWSELKEESDKAAFGITAMLFPEWIARIKQQYSDIDGYELYQKIFMDVFKYDINRMAIETERGADLAALERKIKLMKLNEKIKKNEKKKKGRKE